MKVIMIPDIRLKNPYQKLLEDGLKNKKIDLIFPLKKRYILPRRAGPTGMKIMKSIKNAMDPNNILNPGKIFEL